VLEDGAESGHLEVHHARLPSARIVRSSFGLQCR